MNYAKSFTHYLDVRLINVIEAPSPNDIMIIRQEIEDAAIRLDETIPSAVKFFIHGFLMLKQGRLQESLVQLAEAKHKSAASPSIALKYYIDYGVGIALVRAGNYAEAIVALTQATECTYLDSIKLAARIYGNLGYIFLETHDYSKAHSYCELSWETCDQNENIATKPILTNLAYSNTKLGRYDIAEQQFAQYRQHLSQNPNLLGSFFYGNAYGAHLEILGEIDESLEQFKVAIDSAEKLNDNIYLLDSLHEYCRCASKHQRFDVIHSYLSKAISLAYEYGSANLMRDFAEILKAVGRRTEDLDHRCDIYEHALELQSKAIVIHTESINESISQLYQLHSERPKLEDAQSLANNLKLISSFGEYLGSHNNLTDMAFRLNKDLGKIMSVDCLALGLYNEEKKQIQYNQFIDLGQLLDPFSINCEDESTLSTYCIKNKSTFVHGHFSPAILQNLLSGKPTANAFVGTTEEDYPSIMMIPLTLDDKILGILTIQSHLRHAYQDYHVSLIKHLCSYIAVDLQNKQHKKQLEEQKKELNNLVNLDPLTGLYNRVSLASSIKNLQECARTSNQLAVLLIDIDYYKQFNDSYGHIRGDEVLLALAHLLRTTFSSETCKVFRYGGDEFLILTECLKLQEIEKKISQLQAELHSLNIEHNSSKCSDRITLSIGGARFESDFKNTLLDSELIQRADEALYSVKAKGRNGVLIKKITPNSAKMTSLPTIPFI
ncbi:diguanylate cyclase [Vibrio gallaecicus]|uniref:sensor domain-containing diguanylate cyclase n=1 Tax=Vibrio gallaecicus TaxID=552386 RepID=UPI0010C96514|nr:diguanylate cyclase [Vibrio gallaecicus]MDN3616629.1 diguanylate cyclase [Vibrio gallaecicus]